MLCRQPHGDVNDPAGHGFDGWKYLTLHFLRIHMYASYAEIVEETPALHGVRCIGEVTDLHQDSRVLYFMLTNDNAEIPCVHRANC